MALPIWISRTSYKSIVFVFHILLLLPNTSLTSNFDLRNPIVIHDRFDKTESHFGATVTLVAPDIGTGWILIAAPKADSPLQNYSKVKEPGLVWKCSLGLDEANHCSILEIDNVGEFDAKIGKVPLQLIHRDRKDYGMLGSAMAMGRGTSDRFVVCSSRWTNQKYKDHHLMNGLCYWLPKTSLFTHNSTAPDFSHRLLPLVNSSRQAYTLASEKGEPVERRFDWAFGQAGFSIDLSGKNELLLGAPGILEWAGSVIQYRDWDPIKLNRPYRRFNQKDATFAQVLVPQAQTLINRDIINYFDYLGYAVTSGHFFNLPTKQTQYAAGAPRGNSLAGKVLVFKFKEEPRDSETPPDDALHFLIDPIIGTSTHFFGSYFGSTLGALDVNGDGLDDLLIGAPLYETTLTTVTESTSTNSSDSSDHLLSAGDEGCVFVYFSLGNDFGREPQEICGDSRPGARFGSSICPLGDINHDTFQDVAIGAPYEAENRGSVYIYIGSQKKLILSQKITPENFEVPLRGFGYSLSGGVDVDQNAYGDLAIGAYESNHVVIYRSFAVVDLSMNLSTSVGALNSSTGLFTITACLSFKGHNISQELDIWMKLNLDPEFRKSRIVDFLPDDRVRAEHFSKGSIQLYTSYQREGTCHTFNVTTVGDLDLVTIPVTVKQDVWLEKGEEAEPRPIYYELSKSKKGFPTLEGNKENQKFFWRPKPPTIQTSGSGAVSPTVISIPITAICEEDGDPICLADLSLNASFRTTEGIFFFENEEYVIGSSKSVVLQIELSNHREAANLPLTIDISWEGPPVIRSSKSDCTRMDTMSNDEKYYICTLLTPLSKNKKETLELELDMTGLYAGSGEERLQFQLIANTSSALVNDPILNVQFPLTQKSQLVFLGQQSEAFYYDNITAETVNFTQLFEVGLTGVSPIYGIQIQVALPASLYIDNMILPLLRVREPLLTYDGVIMNCRSVNGTFYEEISYEDIELIPGRMKRDTTNRLPKKKSTILEQPITVNCQTLGVECLLVECEALAFKPSYRALVEFRLRLVTETARKVFMDKDRDVMIIESMSRVKRLGSIHESKFAISRTLIRAELPGEIKVWILIVATGGGFILFTLITLVLTRCGFFRRTKLEELAKLKAKQQGMGQFLFDELEVGDSLEYYDVALTESDFDYRYDGSHFRPNESFSDGLYDELQLGSTISTTKEILE